MEKEKALTQEQERFVKNIYQSTEQFRQTVQEKSVDLADALKDLMTKDKTYLQ